MPARYSVLLMSDGNHPMGDGSQGPGLWAPRWDDVPKGARPILLMLIVWRDGRGSCDPTHEEIAAALGLEARAVGRHMKWLTGAGYVKRARARERGNDGRMCGHRYWLHLDKLGLNHHVPEGLKVADGARSPPQNSTGSPPDNLSGGQNVGASATRQFVQPPDNLTGGATGQFAHPPDNLTGGKTPENQGAYIEPGARAGAATGARISLPLPSSSFFLSFPWEDEKTKKQAECVLLACGPKLGELGKQNDRVLASLAKVLSGPWAAFDFERDVLPVVRHKTTERATALWDFGLITSNIETHWRRRLRDEQQAARAAGLAAAKGFGGRGGFAGFAAGGADADARRRERMRTLRRLLSDFEAGDRTMTFELAPKDRGLSGDWLEGAFAPVVAAWKAELERLVAEDGADGGGDGA